MGPIGLIGPIAKEPRRLPWLFLLTKGSSINAVWYSIPQRQLFRFEIAASSL